MNEEQQKKLREEFPASQVGKLPKGNVTLDYVGHGAVTDRLLEVDPEWNWEPMSVDEDGFPKLDQAGNLWIRLTVGGVTRLGVGDGATMKVLIGDALRNAAMRFGVALDLWIRGHAEDDEQRTPEPPRQRPVQAAPVSSVPLANAQDHFSIRMLIESLTDEQRPAFVAWWKLQKLPGIKTQDALTETQAELIFGHFDDMNDLNGEPVDPADIVDFDDPGFAERVAEAERRRAAERGQAQAVTDLAAGAPGLQEPGEEPEPGSPATARAVMDAAKTKPVGAKR